MKKKLELNDKASIRMNNSFNSFVVVAEGYENLSFLEKDCRNHIEKVRCSHLSREGDAIPTHH